MDSACLGATSIGASQPKATPISALASVKKLKGPSCVQVAAAHNLRAHHGKTGRHSSIQPTRSHLNETLVGPDDPKVIAEMALALMNAGGAKTLRKDAVRAIEWVFSLPPSHAIDDRALFLDAVSWVASRNGGRQNILCAHIHRDEPAPHCHVLVLPLIEGRMNGSDLVGGPAKLRALQEDFYQSVAAHHGLVRSPPRLRGAAKEAAAKQVLEILSQRQDAALQSVFWSTIRRCIETDPGSFLMALGSAAPNTKRQRSFAQIFTSPGKGPTDRDAEQSYEVCRD